MEGGCVAIRVGGILHAAAGIGVISDLRVSGVLLPDKPGKIKYHWQGKACTRIFVHKKKYNFFFLFIFSIFFLNYSRVAAL